MRDLQLYLQGQVRNIYCSYEKYLDSDKESAPAYLKRIQKEAVEKLRRIKENPPANHFLSGSDADENLQAMRTVAYGRMVCRTVLAKCYHIKHHILQSSRQPEKELQSLNHYIDNLIKKDIALGNEAIDHGLTILKAATAEDRATAKYHNQCSAVKSLLAQQAQYRKQDKPSADANVAQRTASMASINSEKLVFAHLPPPQKIVETAAPPATEASSAFAAHAASLEPAATQTLNGYFQQLAHDSLDPLKQARIIDTCLITTPASIQELIQKAINFTSLPKERQQIMQAFIQYATDRSQHQPAMINQVFEQIRLLDSEHYAEHASHHIQRYIDDFNKIRPRNKISMALSAIQNALTTHDLVTARFHMMRAKAELYSWKKKTGAFKLITDKMPYDASYQALMDKITFHIDGIQRYHHGACLPAVYVPKADHFNAEMCLRYPSLLETTENNKVAILLTETSASAGKGRTFASVRSKTRKKTMTARVSALRNQENIQTTFGSEYKSAERAYMEASVLCGLVSKQSVHNYLGAASSHRLIEFIREGKDKPKEFKKMMTGSLIVDATRIQMIFSTRDAAKKFPKVAQACADHLNKIARFGAPMSVDVVTDPKRFERKMQNKDSDYTFYAHAAHCKYFQSGLIRQRDHAVKDGGKRLRRSHGQPWQSSAATALLKVNTNASSNSNSFEEFCEHEMGLFTDADVADYQTQLADIQYTLHAYSVYKKPLSGKKDSNSLLQNYDTWFPKRRMLDKSFTAQEKALDKQLHSDPASRLLQDAKSREATAMRMAKSYRTFEGAHGASGADMFPLFQAMDLWESTGDKPYSDALKIIGNAFFAAQFASPKLNGRHKQEIRAQLWLHLSKLAQTNPTLAAIGVIQQQAMLFDSSTGMKYASLPNEFSDIFSNSRPLRVERNNASLNLALVDIGDYNLAREATDMNLVHVISSDDAAAASLSALSKEQVQMQRRVHERLFDLYASQVNDVQREGEDRVALTDENQAFYNLIDSQFDTISTNAALVRLLESTLQCPLPPHVKITTFDAEGEPHVTIDKTRLLQFTEIMLKSDEYNLSEKKNQYSRAVMRTTGVAIVSSHKRPSHQDFERDLVAALCLSHEIPNNTALFGGLVILGSAQVFSKVIATSQDGRLAMLAKEIREGVNSRTIDPMVAVQFCLNHYNELNTSSAKDVFNNLVKAIASSYIIESIPDNPFNTEQNFSQLAVRILCAAHSAAHSEEILPARADMLIYVGDFALASDLLHISAKQRGQELQEQQKLQLRSAVITAFANSQPNLDAAYEFVDRFYDSLLADATDDASTEAIKADLAKGLAKATGMEFNASTLESKEAISRHMTQQYLRQNPDSVGELYDSLALIGDYALAKQVVTHGIKSLTKKDHALIRKEIFDAYQPPATGDAANRQTHLLEFLSPHYTAIASGDSEQIAKNIENTFGLVIDKWAFDSRAAFDNEQATITAIDLLRRTMPASPIRPSEVRQFLTSLIEKNETIFPDNPALPDDVRAHRCTQILNSLSGLGIRISPADLQDQLYMNRLASQMDLYARFEQKDAAEKDILTVFEFTLAHFETLMPPDATQEQQILNAQMLNRCLSSVSSDITIALGPSQINRDSFDNHAVDKALTHHRVLPTSRSHHVVLLKSKLASFESTLKVSDFATLLAAAKIEQQPNQVRGRVDTTPTTRNPEAQHSQDGPAKNNTDGAGKVARKTTSPQIKVYEAYAAQHRHQSDIHNKFSFVIGNYRTLFADEETLKQFWRDATGHELPSHITNQESFELFAAHQCPDASSTELHISDKTRFQRDVEIITSQTQIADESTDAAVEATAAMQYTYTDIARDQALERLIAVVRANSTYGTASDTNSLYQLRVQLKLLDKGKQTRLQGMLEAKLQPNTHTDLTALTPQSQQAWKQQFTKAMTAAYNPTPEGKYASPDQVLERFKNQLHIQLLLILNADRTPNAAKNNYDLTIDAIGRHIKRITRQADAMTAQKAKEAKKLSNRFKSGTKKAFAGFKKIFSKKHKGDAAHAQPSTPSPATSATSVDLLEQKLQEIHNEKSKAHTEYMSECTKDYDTCAENIAGMIDWLDIPKGEIEKAATTTTVADSSSHAVAPPTRRNTAYNKPPVGPATSSTDAAASSAKASPVIPNQLLQLIQQPLDADQIEQAITLIEGEEIDLHILEQACREQLLPKQRKRAALFQPIPLTSLDQELLKAQTIDFSGDCDSHPLVESIQSSFSDELSSCAAGKDPKEIAETYTGKINDTLTYLRAKALFAILQSPDKKGEIMGHHGNMEKGLNHVIEHVGEKIQCLSVTKNQRPPKPSR